MAVSGARRRNRSPMPRVCTSVSIDLVTLPLDRTAPADARHASWAELTHRLTALCLRDRARYLACADRSDALEAAGIEPLLAVRQALEEHGG